MEQTHSLWTVVDFLLSVCVGTPLAVHQDLFHSTFTRFCEVESSGVSGPYFKERNRCEQLCDLNVLMQASFSSLALANP